MVSYRIAVLTLLVSLSAFFFALIGAYQGFMESSLNFFLRFAFISSLVVAIMFLYCLIVLTLLSIRRRLAKPGFQILRALLGLVLAIGLGLFTGLYRGFLI